MSKQNTSPDATQRVPQLRFKGFTGAWEQRKLSYLLIPSEERNGIRGFAREEVLSVSRQFGVVNQIAFQGRSFAGKDLSQYRIVEESDVVYTKSPLKDNPFGIIQTNHGKAGIVSTLYAVYHPTAALHPSFIEEYFASNSRLNRYLHPLVNKGAKNDMKVKNLDVLKGLVTVPLKEEQNQISKFFQVLDSRITAQERKCDLLKKKKIAYLQQIFSQKLRFKGFTGAWQQCKSRDWFEAISEKGRPELPILASTQSDGLVYRSQLSKEVHYDSEALNGYKRVRLGDFIISLRSFQGGFELSDKEGIVSPAYTVFHFKDSSLNSSGYWKTLFKTFSFIESLKTVTFGIRDGKAISFQDFGSMRLTYPDRNEQERIGNFFHVLDSMIAVQESKLNLLKRRKQAYLQKLFI